MNSTTKFVTDTGEVRVRKFLGIPLGTPELPNPTDDAVLVLRSKSGRLEAVERPTPGERTWGLYDVWYIVDTSPHQSVRIYDDILVTSDAGFTVRVTVSVRVSDPAAAVKNTSVTSESVIDQVLRREVDEAVFGFLNDSADFSPRPLSDLASDVDDHGRPRLGSRWFDSEKVYAMRVSAQRALNSALTGRTIDGLGWTELVVTGVGVDYDADTKTHLASIKDGRRATELTAVTHQVTESETLSKMKIRAMWRNELKGYLTDRSMRAFEEVYDDPTPEKMRAAVAKVDENEQRQMEQLLGVVSKLAENGEIIHSDESFVDAVAKLREIQLHDERPSQPETVPELASAPVDSDRRDRDWS